MRSIILAWSFRIHVIERKSLVLSISELFGIENLLLVLPNLETLRSEMVQTKQ